MIVDIKKKNAVCKQLVPVEEVSYDIPSIIQAGLRMSTNEFESFVQSKFVFIKNNNRKFCLETAPDSYWHIMAEHYRTKLEEVTRENQQVR